MEKILIFLFFIFFLTPAYAQDASSVAELERQAKEKEAELKKIKEEEKKISKEITALQKQTAERDRLINKIDSDISLVEQNIITAENKREALSRSGPMWQGTLFYDAEEHFIKSLLDTKYYDSAFLEEELLFDKAIPQKAAFLARLNEEQSAALNQITGYEEKNKELQKRTAQVELEKTVLTKDFLKKKTDLDATQKKYAQAKKQLDELNKSAEEMKKILTAAEDKRKKEAEKQAKAQHAPAKTTTAVIDIAQNSLAWPVEGSVISSFGKEYRSDLKTWIFRDGVKIAAVAHTAVKSVAEGAVIYSGAFRSYGNVVIVDHGKGFFTIYGFLNQISVNNGDSVGLGTQLGTVGQDTQQGSMGSGKTALYFEVRRGTSAEDPLKWLQN